MAKDDKKKVKKKCVLCICGIKSLKWIPVFFIMKIVAWSYYAYVVQLNLLTLQSQTKQIIFLTFYHLFFFLFCWTYLKTIFTKIKSVPDMFKLPDVEYELLIHAESESMQKQILENFSRKLPVTNQTISGTIRYCEKCKHVKPDRAHHCSICGVCVLKMDHHCPWINNCVSFSNYKFFILFLVYSLTYCLYISSTSLPYFIAYWSGDLDGVARFHILFLFFVAVMFAVSLISLFSYHCYLVLRNRTTLEAFRAPIFRTGPDKNGFNLGYYNNFKQVFGNNPKTWLIPISTSLGNGYTFPLRRTDEDTEKLLSDSQQWEEEVSVTQ